MRNRIARLRGVPACDSDGIALATSAVLQQLRSIINDAAFDRNLSSGTLFIFPLRRGGGRLFRIDSGACATRSRVAQGRLTNAVAHTTSLVWRGYDPSKNA